MSYKVKITMMGFLGDEKKYPCHFQHKPGDTIIFDGERYEGRLCSSLWTLVVPVVQNVHTVGPSYKPPHYYYPFWYAPISVDDPSLKKYDGLGFRNVLETAVEPQYHMANLKPRGAFDWPPPPPNERNVASTPMVVCGDTRTAALFKIEAVDLADRGYHIPYYRRQMVILNKVLSNQGIAEDKVIDLFSKEENEGIYPVLSQIMIAALDDELQAVGYLDRKGGGVSVTQKGKQKLETFKASLPAEEREALNL